MIRLLAVIAVAGASAAAGLTLSKAPSRQDDPTAALSKRQLAGQMVVFGYAGLHVPQRLLKRVRRGEAGGVIVFDRNISSRKQLRAQMLRLQGAARASKVGLPLLTMVDQEGGLVKRLPGPPVHSPRSLGRIGRARLARREGENTARNLGSVALNVNLAPVVDVGRRGSFQLRTGRSYGSNARLVASLGTAFVRGLQGGRRTAATLKHFPGLGTIGADEDQLVQRVPVSRAKLRSVDEYPFSKAINAGAAMVMTSTAIYPALDRVPALMSRAIVNGELRGRLGFTGVTITDDLEVPALHRYGSTAQSALRAAHAGNDLLLFAQHYRTGVDGFAKLVRAVRSGRLELEHVRESARRVLELRRQLA